MAFGLAIARHGGSADDVRRAARSRRNVVQARRFLGGRACDGGPLAHGCCARGRHGPTVIASARRFRHVSVRPQHPKSDPAAQDFLKWLRRRRDQPAARDGNRSTFGDLVSGRGARGPEGHAGLYLGAMRLAAARSGGAAARRWLVVEPQGGRRDGGPSRPGARPAPARLGSAEGAHLTAAAASAQEPEVRYGRRGDGV